jgi:hypothetical protein
VSAALQGDTQIMGAEKGLKEVLRRLCDLSVERAYDPFRDFEWPASVPEDGLWMSEDLLSVHGTPYMAELTEAERWRLSRWELVNFFSFNVHGIKELMQTVLSCIHKAGHETTSEYFHHFLDEENKHMWFFAEFCRRYGGKIYVTQKVQFPSFSEDDIQNFIAFAKILISEQVSDFYNVRMMTDESLHPIVRKLNRVHHEDESRHIAMGLSVVRLMYEPLVERYPSDTLRQIANYLSRYIQFFFESFYNPSAYRDAGLQDPYEWRRKLIENPARKEFHGQVLRRTANFFHSSGIAQGEII